MGFYFNDIFEIDEVFIYFLNIYCYFVNGYGDLNDVLGDFVRLCVYFLKFFLKKFFLFMILK